MIIDITSLPPRLNGVDVLDKAEQAAEPSEDLKIFDAAGVDATFVFTFVAPTSPTSDDPLYDLDMASYAVVKSHGNRLGDLGTTFPDMPWNAIRSGTTYPDMPLEPKLAFGAVADFYRGQAERSDSARATKLAGDRT
jgi:hypothetical protein